jgi:hypothetical protein
MADESSMLYFRPVGIKIKIRAVGDGVTLGAADGDLHKAITRAGIINMR